MVNLKCIFLLAIAILATEIVPTDAFVTFRPCVFPAGAANSAAPTSVNRSPTASIPTRDSVKLQVAKVDLPPLPATPRSALVVAFGMICAACAPYVVGLFFPRLLDKLFFLPVYTNDKAGRKAEIYWKLMYATLGLSLTTLGFVEVFFTDRSPTAILKDSYVLWSLFYTAAIIKIRYEATRLKIIAENRVFIQLWHSLVVLVMYAAVFGNPLFVYIYNLFARFF
jgi:hypothetical protein